MADFNVRSDSVNVEQIMRQIRARIREKRGVDYTEEQIRELAAVKLERILDPAKVRSDLLKQFHEGGISPLPNYAFEEDTIYESRRLPLLTWIRRLLNPLLKLLFNPNPLISALHLQSDINTRHAHYTELSYEILHNLVLEVTRLGIEVKNLKMRVESLSGRLEFSERRVRALEGVVEYRPGAIAEEQPADAAKPGQAGETTEQAAGGSESRRRRRRRRGRRGGAGRPGAGEEATAGGSTEAQEADEGEAPDGPGEMDHEAGAEGPAPASAPEPPAERENQ